MKKQPVISTSAPSYPTLAEVETSVTAGKVLKGVAVTALVASTALAATGCFDSYFIEGGITEQTETTILMGETTVFTDCTDYTE